MVEMVMTAKPARRRHIKEMLRQGLETTAFVVEAVCFGEEHGPDRLIGWLVRANAADQALITTVFKGRLAHGPEGARGDSSRRSGRPGARRIAGVWSWPGG